MASQVIAFVADLGGDRGAGTTFYYNIGAQGGGYTPVDSLGPGADAVAELVRSWNPSDVFNIGDQPYTVGSSTIVDTAIGQHFNDFMYPYPSPYYLKGDYLKIGGNAIVPGQKTWPYNIFDFPNGFPNPKTGGPGGSADKRNHYWGTLGDHEYGLAIGFAQVGVTPYDSNNNGIGTPLAPSSTRVPGATIDYAMPWLNDPTLLGSDASRLNIGNVDPTGNSGTYYSISFGNDGTGAPMLEVFNLDTERLDINSGFEDWNPGGLNTLNSTGQWLPTVSANPSYSITYDPTDPKQSPLPGSTTDINNGYKQYTWLRDSLAKSKAKWKIVTGHHPVYTSGQWGQKQPADHMSIPYMQKLLDALPNGSFDAFYNGHDHYYERVLEQNDSGIGQGIPFITNGNSGRILYTKGQVPYGTSVYTPISPGTSNSAAINELLPSNPVSVASSGLAFQGSTNTAGLSPGLYAYGFGATRSEFDKDYLFFNYQQAALIDPAIANHLSSGVNPETGFAGTTSSDWIPNPNGTFSGLPDLAYFGIEVTNGVVTNVKIINGGSGYMSSKGGNHTVTGFNIYGNNTDLVRPWINTAQVDLTFSGGVLTNVVLTNGGSGYELAAAAALSNNSATGISFQPDPSNQWESLRIPLNYRLNESTYLIRGNNNVEYQDWYLITDTALSATALNRGSYGGMRIEAAPSSSRAKEILSTQNLPSGYSGIDQQAKYTSPQTGNITIKDSTKTTIGSGTIGDGISSFLLNQLAAPGPVEISYSGDFSSSYLTNFKASTKTLNLSYGNWSANTSVNESAKTINFGANIRLTLTRTDSGSGLITFGLDSVGTNSSNIELLKNAAAANGSSLSTGRIFTQSGIDSWLQTEGKSQGSSSASSSTILAGNYLPTAIDSNGSKLALQSISNYGNTVTANFSGGVTARYSVQGTGISTNLPGPGDLTVTVQRLGQNKHGLAFYEADLVTGAIVVDNIQYLPGQSGYLNAAYLLATRNGLVINSSAIPSYQSSASYANLPLLAGKNYGLLVDRGSAGTDLISSYANANPNTTVQAQTFQADNRGIIYGFEDLRPNEFAYDADFNDLIVTISSSDFTII